MEEKITIKGEQYNIKAISLCILGIGSLFFLKGVAIAFDVFPEMDMGYMLTSAIPYYAGILSSPFLVIAGFFYWYASKISLTVTNKRVYGTAAFGKRVDLPLDKISAVGTSFFKGVSVSTSSGIIKFVMIKNKDNIHDEISKLLLNRQDNLASSITARKDVSKSNTEELKRYKELLDSGVITQDEFDAKKRQLLGL